MAFNYGDFKSAGGALTAPGSGAVSKVIKKRKIKKPTNASTPAKQMATNRDIKSNAEMGAQSVLPPKNRPTTAGAQNIAAANSAANMYLAKTRKNRSR